MSDSVQLLLLIYGAGYITAFLLFVVLLLAELFSYNSTYKNNLRLILVERTFLGTEGNYFQPEAVSFWNALKAFGFNVLIVLFLSLLSWVQVLVVCVRGVWICVSRLFIPSSVKAYRWKLKNIPFLRAEDLLKHAQEHGFVTTSEQLFTKTLEDLANRSEILTRRYADWVFGSDQEQAEEYVNEARHLTKEVHDSVVIHPRFWAIPQNKDDAETALYVARGYRKREGSRRTSGRIVIPFRSTKGGLIFGIIVSLLFFVGGGIWIFNLPDGARVSVYAQIFVKSFGVLTIGFGVLCSLAWLQKLFHISSGLILDSEGIIDNSSMVGAGRIAWRDICDIRSDSVAKQLAVVVNDPEKYSGKANILRWLFLKLRGKTSGTPIVIYADSLDANFEDLKQHIEEFRRKHSNA